MKLLRGALIPHDIPSSVDGVKFTGLSELVIAVELDSGEHILASHFSDDELGDFKEIPITITRANSDNKP